MRPLFPFLALLFAAIVPACTCGSKPEPPPAPTTVNARTASSLVRPNFRVPGRLQFNSSGLRHLPRAPIASGSSSGAAAPATSGSGAPATSR
jgi:hypothetical protein